MFMATKKLKLKLSNFKNNLYFKDYVEYKNIDKELHKMDVLLIPYKNKIASGEMWAILQILHLL